MNRYILLATGLAALLLVSGLQAQSWSELNARQQAQLSDFQSIWARLPDNRKAQLVRSAEQITRMSLANRRKLVESMTQAAGGNGVSADQRESRTSPR